MSHIVRIIIAAALAAGVGIIVLTLWPLPPAPSLQTMSGDPKRGAYLARLSGCVTCHTRPGAPPLSGGAAIGSNFGAFHAPNITPDPDEGIGSWTFEQFVRAVRQGVSPDEQPYYPAFPYEFYATLTDQDMADLWAAIRSTPPAPQPSEPHQLGFPFNIRVGLKVWRAVLERPAQYSPDETQTLSWNRGRYLVWGPAHCAACHVARNALGGLSGTGLDGDPHMQGGGSSPPLTAAALLSRGYTREALVAALRTGIAPDGDVFGGSMAEVVRGSTAYLLEQHLVDMATYLLDADEE